MSKRRRVFGIGVASLCAALGLLCLGAGPAFAERTYDSEIDGSFSFVSYLAQNNVAFEPNGDVWISDGAHYNPSSNNILNGIYKYSPYPSQTFLQEPETEVPWGGGYRNLNLAFDDTTNELFVAQSQNGRVVDIFKNGVFTHEWSVINGNKVGGTDPLPYQIRIAIDNTNTYSRGRVYLSLLSPENDVEAFDAQQRPVDFPATASYITDNKITGTPSGPFGHVETIAVDAKGNLYISDTANGVTDEFDSSGTFLRSFPGSGGVGVDPTNGNVLIRVGPSLEEYDSSGNYLETISHDYEGRTISVRGSPGVNSEGYLYVPAHGTNSFEIVDIYTPSPVVPEIIYKPVSLPTITAGTLNATVDPNGGGNVTACKFEYGTTTSYSSGELPCEPSPPFASPTDVHAGLSGLTTGTTYYYRAVVTSANGVKYGEDQTYTPDHVLALSTDPATNLSESEATLNGSFVGNGEDTHFYFEWGLTSAYGNKTAAPPGTDAGSPSGPPRTSLSFDLTGLNPFSTYHYRVVATNGAGTANGQDRMLTMTPGIPSIGKESATEVHADRAVLHGQVNPNGADTSAHFEYVDDANFQASGWADATEIGPEVGVGMSKHFQNTSTLVDGLKPGTLYHYRAVGTNSIGVGVPSVDRTFKTFRFIKEINDPCENSHVRQQTGTALLLDCRAYELVSAAQAGGYDVESSLVPGQSPFDGYPEAESPSQVLYAIHNGALGTGNPTNRGIDPYVATRGKEGWSTEYVGIPANNPFASAPFASTLVEAHPGLDAFAFGGPDICSPCFGPGQTETGEPVRLADGSLVQGMAGSIPQPAAKPEGFIGKRFSADASHFVFGSKSQFEPDGNEGEISIYDRDLNGGETHVVSKTPSGETMEEEGTEIGELDISKDGSRIVIGHLVEEIEGAKYWRLYMNIGDSGEAIDLTPGTIHGVLFDGMTEDGSRVFFTTADQLLPADADHSPDIYEAEVDSAGNLTLHLVSTGNDASNPGEPGNTDECEPAANTVHEYWNTTGTEVDCGVVAVSGGGGVASGDGTIYFLSPEKLDGSANGVQDAPNLYLARPGQAPHFLATLESSANAPLPPAKHPLIRSFGAFVNSTGVAIDHASGDVYVLDVGDTEGGPGAFVAKFDSAGNLITSFGENGKINGEGENAAHEHSEGAFADYGALGLPTEIAVDNSSGDLYVSDFLHSVIDKFSPSGEYEGKIPVGLPIGVAVDQANGHLYVASFFSSTVSVFDATGAAIPSASFSAKSNPIAVAVDSGGTVYVANGGAINPEGTAEAYDSSGTFIREVDGNPSFGVAVDPSSDHVYVDEGKQVVELDSSGNENKQVGDAIGSGLLSASIGLAADSGNLDVSNPGLGKVAAFGPSARPPDPATDNPLVIDSVSAPGTHNTADFQLTPSGDDAVFTSTLPLTGYDNAVHREIFRYDAPSGLLECPSCNPTSEQATAEATLPSNGLGLSDDGRVFFDSTEGLVDRDLNGREDAYEWEPQAGGCQEAGGCVELISTGASLFASRLLGISADATDAYFFTRDVLVAQDENGNSVKLYDARSGGGFPVVPAAVPCKASDECHGAGTTPPPPPNIKSIASTPEGPPAIRCRKGFVKRHNKCVRRHKSRRHRSRRHHEKSGGAR